ncbi:MAG: pyruvate kinase, partial [Bacteroidetes bacterium]
MERQTKIICTLGPASSDRGTIRRLIEAGMDVARLNFSHGSHEDHRRVIEFVREAAAEMDRPIPILQDLQGPKIRIGKMQNGGVLIHKGQRLVLTTEPIEYGDRHRVYVNYPTLAQDVDPGNHILIDDGMLELKILEARDGE